jgi:hypothetical protein
LRLVRALAVEMHKNWLEAHRYLEMDDLREHKKEESTQTMSLPRSRDRGFILALRVGSASG